MIQQCNRPNIRRQVTRAGLLWVGLICAAAAVWSAESQEVPTAGGLLEVGELVFVDVYRRPEASTTTQIDDSGNVQLPFVGNVNIAGLTENEASARVRTAFSAVLKNPRVTVSRTAPDFGEGYRLPNMKTEILPLNNANAESLSVALQGMTSEGGSVAYDPDTNSLIITDTPDAIQNMLHVTSRLDQMQSQLTQVRIEAKIAEVKIGAMKELGVRWFVQGTDVNGGYYPLPTQDVGINALKGQSASPINNESFSQADNAFGQSGDNAGRNFVDGGNFDRLLNVPVQIPKAGQFFFGLMNDHVDLGLMLDALVADDEAELLASPNILTVNHKSAEISMVDEFPYTEFGIETTGRSNFSIRFLELGIKMAVTPHVLQDTTGRYVKLEFNPEVSFPTGSSNGIPIRSVREYQGESNVRDGQTLVVGGIYRNDLRNVEQRVPGLGKVPLLGNLFKHTEKARSETELMLFLTPTIHDSPESVTWDRMLDVTANSKIVGPAIQQPQQLTEVRRN